MEPPDGAHETLAGLSEAAFAIYRALVGLRAVLPVHAGRRLELLAHARLPPGPPAAGERRRPSIRSRRSPGLRVDTEPLPSAGLVRLRNGVRRGRRLRASPSLPRLAVLPLARREPRDDAREVEPRDRLRLPRARGRRAAVPGRSPTSAPAPSSPCSRSWRRGRSSAAIRSSSSRSGSGIPTSTP